jgi:CheY-like chemotaxis protein
VNFGGRRILVLDDNPVNRRVIRQILESVGVRVTESWNGAPALAALREAASANRPFDAALLDFHMPDMDGLMVAQEIRGDPAFDELRLLFLSSVRDAISPADSARLRISAQMVKPIRRNQILAELARVLGAAAVPSAPTPVGPIEPSTRINVLVA